jgi:hypothetical protein
LQNLQQKERDQPSCKICNQKREINQVGKFVTKRETNKVAKFATKREREQARKIANFAKTKERTKQFATKKDGESC